ncbi:MAG: 2-dehydro-3-deoxygalactonokinase [Pseudomonadota bacterium]|nr:2-dehydro-3-deoxygalactonokinase [Pseudomonadota bacterium]
MADEADIVLVDWGTSSLRVWTLDRWGAIVGQRRSDRGMGRLSPADFGSELQANLTALDVDGDVPVLICGMAGAAQGWQEAQYIDIPSDLAALAGAAVRVTGQPRDIRILPGMAQRDIACPDVMRGEETILYGLVCQGIETGLVCLPGTHAKWARVRDSRLTDFRTFMTGELYELLAARSILRHTVADGEWSDSDFVDAVTEAFTAPAKALTGLFALRAGPLLFGQDSQTGAARLSGLLIGAELAISLEAHGSEPLILAAPDGAADRYLAACALLDVACRRVDAEAAVRDGLYALASKIWPERKLEGRPT